jgi:glutathione S-transferase
VECRIVERPQHQSVGQDPRAGTRRRNDVFSTPRDQRIPRQRRPQQQADAGAQPRTNLVKRWEALADGICDAAATAFLEAKRPAKQQDKTWIERQRSKIASSLEFMAEELGDNAHCMGTHFSLADAAVGSALGYLVFRFADINWQEAHPNLSKLYDKLMQRPSFADTVPQA